MPSQEFRILYITAANSDEAMRLAKGLVEARLAACANILGGINSVYWWQGKIEEGSEVALIAKTRADLVEECIAKVKELHSYSCPCVIALPILAGNPPYLEWLAAETVQD
jgi:periplasmic divalent cation tolerance protein